MAQTNFQKVITVKVVDTYTGGCLAFRVKSGTFIKSDKRFSWMSEGQRKRLEDRFGNIRAYHCDVFSPEDDEFNAYYAEKD